MGRDVIGGEAERDQIGVLVPPGVTWLTRMPREADFRFGYTMNIWDRPLPAAS